MTNPDSKPASNPGSPAAAPTDAPTAPSEPESAGPEVTERLARGVQAARLLEEASERVRRARRRAKRAKKSDARLNARKQLKKLRRRLQELQETVLSRGIDAEEHHTLAALLHALDLALDDFRDGKPRRKALRTIARAAKTTRKSL